MAPAWFPVDDIPYDEMWDDDAYWLPRVLAGERVQATYMYQADNQTVQTFDIQDWNVEAHGERCKRPSDQR
jgi:8-oxo-dGTP diphosphatase